ncbi:DNA-3-methyladenine glycosylase I [Bisgaardia hudsonensis]|uniref:DNA-3-methyladenine glycosylase I n=1 Tax=Bisgaardia hudsonensis TaxID=109472 RepID=A0A4R2MUM4_9PAST|nr:DNA-3-methyladenine glycosylase I [Bisgaardia hudsonensis]QLB12344.1 DNA-3-methyladenine glycosidase [Bisgaardia hudsonensis]TCP12392.1 DNA-3-methyladenine glycosylase I [Bisgaardia hudsonensis]
MVIRCSWVTDDEIYIKYHDEEWGKPQYDSLKLFEQICLEGQQAGLSWITVLKKRENYRKAFYQFDPYKIIHIDSQEINIMLDNKGLIRHKLKLEAIVKNANAYIQMEKRGENFSDFIWSFVNHQPQINDIQTTDHRPTQTAISKKMSQELKKRGFVFVGETICYAFMQSMGLVNDHINDCLYK